MFTFLTLLISLHAGAVENWFPFGKAGAATMYAQQAACETTEAQACYDVTSCMPDVCSLVSVDDLTQPKFTKAQVTACAGENECRAELAALTCTAGAPYIDANFTQVYCAVPNGYGSKLVLQSDPAKVAAKTAQTAQLNQLGELAARGAARRQVGQRIMDVISANNDGKGLTPDQTVALTQQLEPILGLLRTGALESAKAKISALQPSGVITQADIDLTLQLFTVEGY